MKKKPKEREEKNICFQEASATSNNYYYSFITLLV